MNRIELIKGLFTRNSLSTYLEIGSCRGDSLFPIPAQTKIAVDPHFRIPLRKKLRWILSDPRNARIHYVRKESERFFREDRQLLASSGPVDVCLVDGLHTFRAALRDVLDCLEVVREGGWIVMHDCLPPHAASALPLDGFPDHGEMDRIPGWDGVWCGDVWKAVAYLRRHHSDVADVWVGDCDFGLGIVRPRGCRPSGRIEIDEGKFAQIDRLQYAELQERKSEWLGLVSATELERRVNAAVPPCSPAR
jgi:hypothetical protein